MNESEQLKSAASAFARLGGLARARSMTPEQRREACRKAGLASAAKRAAARQAEKAMPKDNC